LDFQLSLQLGGRHLGHIVNNPGNSCYSHINPKITSRPLLLFFFFL
jgi:hypothetical protein